MSTRDIYNLFGRVEVLEAAIRRHEDQFASNVDASNVNLDVIDRAIEKLDERISFIESLLRANIPGPVSAALDAQATRADGMQGRIDALEEKIEALIKMASMTSITLESPKKPQWPIEFPWTPIKGEER